MKTWPTLGCSGCWWVSSLLLAAVFTIFSASALPTNAGPLSQTWSEPQLLSPDTQSSWFPDIAADASGRVHAVWSTSLSAGIGQAYDVVMYTASQDGVVWPPARDIVALPSKGAVTRPSLLTDTAGKLHVTYRSYTVYYTQAPADTVGPSTLLAARQISTPDNGYFSRTAIDKEGRLHLIYTENIQSLDCQGCFHVFYRQSDDGGLTWKQPLDISVIASGAAKPQLVIDEQDGIHVVWEAGLGGDLGQLSPTFATQIKYTASYDRGQTWSTPVQLGSLPTAAATSEPTLAPPATSTPLSRLKTPAVTNTPAAATSAATSAPPAATAVPHSAKNVALGANGRGQLVVAWLGLPEDRVYYQVSGDQGHSWSAPQLIDSLWGAWTVYQGRTDDYAMTTDSAGSVHLVLVGRTAEQQNTLSVLHTTWSGSAWDKPEAVTTLTGDVPEWPRATVGLGNHLHLVWFVRDQPHIFGGEGASQYRVWYAERLLPSPALSPVQLPTAPASAVPSAVVTQSQRVTPGPTPTPSATFPTAPQAIATPELVYNESDYLRVVAKSLLPAAAGILLVVVVVRLLRR